MTQHDVSGDEPLASGAAEPQSEQLVETVVLPRTAQEELPVGEEDLRRQNESWPAAPAMVEELRLALDRSRSIVEAAPDAIVILESDGCISLVNTQTERMFGYCREELLGSPVEVLMAERFRDVHRSHRVRYLASPVTRPMGAGLDLYGRRKDGSEFPVEISLSPLSTKAASSVVSAIRDITDRKQLEAENVRLLQTAQERSEQLQLAIQEAHHRIKNNLQAVSNLFYLASDNTAEPAARKTLQESMDRIQAIALVHDLLSQEEGIQTVDLRSVVERLVPMVIRNHGYAGEAVAVILDVPPTTVSSKMATSLTLILNELTVNAAKHAFSTRGGGRLIVRLSLADEGHRLVVHDDGPGLPSDFELSTHANLGLTVVQTLVERDLDGQLRLANGPGLLAEVWYP
jgi:PAS domain S-box-containing protein